MDLKNLQEQVVQQEARALDLGMATPTPDLIEELRYTLHDVNALRAQLARVGDTRDLRARVDSVYAEVSGILGRWIVKPSAAA